MNKSGAKILLSVSVLAVTALICVSVLVGVNALINSTKKAEILDAETARQLNEVCPAGEDGDYLSYFEMLDLQTAGISLKDFNSQNTSGGSSVISVYKAVKGDNEGSYIIKSSAKGFGGDVTALTAFKEGKVLGLKILSKNSETYWDKIDQSFFDSFIGKSSFSSADINVKTGATYSSTAILNAVKIAAALNTKLAGG